MSECYGKYPKIFFPVPTPTTIHSTNVLDLKFLKRAFPSTIADDGGSRRTIDQLAAAEGDWGAKMWLRLLLTAVIASSAWGNLLPLRHFPIVL